MIRISDNHKCVGCGACADICACYAISMIPDGEGFKYPNIDASLCVDCGSCEQVCPMLQSPKRNIQNQPIVYAAYASNSEVRSQSTSGGLFTIIADSVYERGGYVGGAIYNSDWTVSQIVDSRNRLSELRQSKYIQSSSEGICRQIENLLLKEKFVLYCGTPCQISALHRYLGKDYDNLVTIDFLCRGVASPQLLHNYLSELEKQYGSKVVSVRMKDKQFGWHRFAMKISFANGKEYCKDRNEDKFLAGYNGSSLFLRPSCLQCPFKTIPHSADITIADFWRIEQLYPNMDDNKGTSMVILNSPKGQELFDAIKKNIVFQRANIEDVLQINPLILKNHESEESNVRDCFYKDANTIPFSKLVTNYILPKSTMKEKIKKILKKILPSKVRKCLRPSYWKTHNDLFHEYFDYDVLFYAHWGGRESISKEELNSRRMKIIRCYRKCQATQGTIWNSYWLKKLRQYNDETGVGLIDNLSIGKGLIIGHVGRIVLNADADLSKGHVFITHGVTIGRDIRGKRKGVPQFGKDVVIRCNSTVTGNIKIGDDVLIAPNTFVNFDVPSHSVVIGNPATIHHREHATEGHIGTM